MIELMPVPTQTKLVSVNSTSPGGLAGQPNPTLLPEAPFTTGRQGEKGGVWGTPAITSTAGGGQVGITHSRLALIHVYANVCTWEISLGLELPLPPRHFKNVCV